MKNLLFIFFLLFGAILMAQDPNEAVHNPCEGLSDCECYGDSNEPIDPEKHPDKDKENELNCETNYDPCTCDGIGCDDGGGNGNNGDGDSDTTGDNNNSQSTNPLDNAKAYVSKPGEKLTNIANLPVTTPKQIGNTCVTASMVYLAKIFGVNINRITYDNIINTEKGINIVEDSFGTKDAETFIKSTFNTQPFTNVKDAFNAGSVICASIVIHETSQTATSHNIVIVGTHSNGATIYMDTNYGHLMELNIPSGTKFRYMFEVTGIK